MGGGGGVPYWHGRRGGLQTAFHYAQINLCKIGIFVRSKNRALSKFGVLPAASPW